MKRRIVFLIALILMPCVILASCRSKEDDPLPDVPSLSNCSIEHEEEFGGIYITATIEYFNSLGFEYGDSVDIFFSNGYAMEDLPYYNGYYVDPGEALLVAYPGYDYIKAAVNFGEDLWLIADNASEDGLKEDSYATVVLREKAKYLVHCTEGKDRTGFVCMLIEALAGAGYREMADDYMVTYDNYYEITEAKDPEKYSVILEKNYDTMLQFLAGDNEADLQSTDFSLCARNYLRSAGMEDAQIDAFLEILNQPDQELA